MPTRLYDDLLDEYDRARADYLAASQRAADADAAAAAAFDRYRAAADAYHRAAARRSQPATGPDTV